MLRHLGNFKRADIRENPLLVEFEEWQLDWNGARRDDDALRGVGCDGSVGGCDVNDISLTKSATPTMASSAPPVTKKE